MLKLDSKTTALVLIDLQKGIISRDLAPYSGEHVVNTAMGLAEGFRLVGAPVVLVNVGWSKDEGDILRQPVDQPSAPTNSYPDNFAELADGLAKSGDIVITKHQWGAFYGTELDLQLRRRNIQTLVLAGIATNIGVESTGRQAWEHGYALILAEDATSTFSGEMHDFSISKIFPRISRVMKSANLSFD